jgi:predicted flavoprotein YhiN
MVGLSGIDPRKKVNSVTREERAALCGCIKDLRIRIDGFRPLAEAIIKEGVAPRIICESDGTMAEDALYMKNAYINAGGKI